MKSRTNAGTSPDYCPLLPTQPVKGLLEFICKQSQTDGVVFVYKVSLPPGSHTALLYYLFRALEDSGGLV